MMRDRTMCSHIISRVKENLNSSENGQSRTPVPTNKMFVSAIEMKFAVSVCILLPSPSRFACHLSHRARHKLAFLTSVGERRAKLGGSASEVRRE